MIKKILIVYFLCFLFGTHLSASDVVIQWNNAALQAIENTSAGPTVAARALAIAFTAAYDAWAAYDDCAIGTRYGDLLRRPQDEHNNINKSEAISFAVYRTLSNLFPTQVAGVFTPLMLSLGYNPLNISTNTATPAGIGNTEAANIILFRAGDGANQNGDEPNSAFPLIPYTDYTGYVPANMPVFLAFPSLWQPLGAQRYLTPQWGLVTPFALKSGNQFLPEQGPALYPSKNYTEQAKEILHLNANLNNLTKSIALYWADPAGSVTPPGHWNQIAQFVSSRDSLNLNRNVKLFFALNNALLDASIAAWDAKRFYDSVRPVSAIRFLFEDKIVEAWGGPCFGTQSILGQNFQSYIPTPPFPEFVSGHSTFSAASAEVLKLFTGSDKYGDEVVITAGSSFVEPGCAPTKDVTLRWNTFTKAAEEAGLSRLYGGIHFEEGNLEGQKIGRKVGCQAFNRAQYFITGGDNDGEKS